ncbi:hypothetical protein LINPERHAP1_LOCUS6299 [Linum perenne]
MDPRRMMKEQSIEAERCGSW